MKAEGTSVRTDPPTHQEQNAQRTKQDVAKGRNQQAAAQPGVTKVASSHDGQAQGFRAPNYSQIPNDLMDYWLPELSGAESKVLLYLARRTFGFHRNRVEVGLRGIANGIPGKDRGTGLHIETVGTAVKHLEAIGLIACERSPGGRTIYTIRVADEVYGKSGHPLSENPHSALYGKSEHEERKSSSEKKYKKESNTARLQGNPRLRRAEAPDAPTLKAQSILSSCDDDGEPEATESIAYTTPKEELQHIYRTKTGSEISRDLLNRISESCELRGVTLASYMEALRPHVPNAWRNPGGFLTDFARKIHLKSPANRLIPELAPVALTIKETPRCDECRGTGRHGEGYCGCQLGRELERKERKMIKETPTASQHQPTAVSADVKKAEPPLPSSA